MPSKDWKARQRAAGKCTGCADGVPVKGRSSCEACLVKYQDRRRRWVDRNPEQNRAHQRRWNVRLRNEVIEAYGGKCACCGEDEPWFLSIDHVDGKGGVHRRHLGGGGVVVYRWLKQHGFPRDGYQLLCFNCNQAKGMYGICAHQRTAPINSVVAGGA